MDLLKLARGNTVIKFDFEPEVEEPVLVEGLPGIGHVGKLAAEAMIEDLGAEKFAELYSPYFPPHVSVNEDGIVEVMRNEFYVYESEGDEPDIIFLIGEAQAQGELGQHEVTIRVLQTVKEFGTEMIFTLGGLGTGTVPTEPKVVGAATHKELIDLLKEHGIEVRSGDKGGNIVGASGLLLGFGKMMGMKGVCLMGVTPGHVIDPRAAMAVVEKLSTILGVEVEADSLKKRAERFEREFMAQLEEMPSALEEAQQEAEEGKPEEDLRYIG
ncbi:proteasome assembly chaperone family protein [Methanopyrus sp.]